MDPFVAQLTQILALGTIVLQISSILLILFFFRKEARAFIAYTLQYGLHVTAALSVAGTILTLVYSDIFGFVPCGLCWFERICLYPIALISTLALLKGDRSIYTYTVPLSGIGALISLYHHYLQMGGSAVLGCPAAGADCAKRIIFEFGYITFPLMAFSLFVMLCVIGLINIYRKDGAIAA